jgi:hypothetical protein
MTLLCFAFSIHKIRTNFECLRRNYLCGHTLPKTRMCAKFSQGGLKITDTIANAAIDCLRFMQISQSKLFNAFPFDLFFTPCDAIYSKLLFRFNSSRFASHISLQILYKHITNTNI